MATMEQLVQAYHKVKGMIAEAEALHKLAQKPHEEKLGVIEGAIVAKLEAEGVESMRTSAGTPYFSHPETYKVLDTEAFVDWLVENKAYGVLPTTIARKEALRDAMEESLAPGIEVTKSRVLRVRKD